MFGGIAAAGAERIWYAAVDGHVVGIEVEGGAVIAQFAVYPSGPESVHVSACAVDRDGTILLGDVKNRCVRRFDDGGLQIARYGALANPGIDDQDEAGVLTEPCGLLADADGILVASGAFGLKHGVQRLDAGGAYRSSFAAPQGGWRRAHGLARVGGEIWVAETEAGLIRRHAPDGSRVGDLKLPDEIARPFRLAADGYGGALVLLAPESAEEQEVFGVAQVTAEAGFLGWIVDAGEKGGQVVCPFDVTVLPDGRFVVADLPLGTPPDVRLQVFASDGRLLRTLMEDVADLQGLQKRWFEKVLARRDGSAATLYEQARVHHYYAGGARECLRQAADLYHASRQEEDTVLAALGMAAALAGLGDPEGAERAYRAAAGLGADPAECDARIAECRHARGDLDGAIGLLEAAVAAPAPPEDYHRRVEALGTWYLERSGESDPAVL